jgi:selenocysteine-specific elongation factor
MIVVTAGHVDHGKTTLVRALTGTDTDTLAEEKRRGLTIELGFAYTDIGKHRIGFVDVPGHQRFIRNMLAGVAAPDAVMLVVAGDEGIMPQTREHLRIIELSGISNGVVVVTRTDRADEETLAIVESELEEILAGTALCEAPVVRACAPENTGLAALRDELETLASQTPEPSPSGCFRLCVDRIFVRKGAGVVVTGAVHSGAVAKGAELELPRTGAKVRVRAVFADGAACETAHQGQRCALNLNGIERDGAVRGDWLIEPNSGAMSTRIDVMLDVPADADALKRRMPVHVYHGAAHRTGHVTLLDCTRLPGAASGWARLRLDEGICAVHGDRLVLRNQAADITIAGGTVVDAFAPTGREFGRLRARKRLRQLEANLVEDAQSALSQLLALGEPVHLDNFTKNRALTDGEAADLLRAADLVEPGGELAGFAVATGTWNALEASLLDCVSSYVSQSPESTGLDVEGIREILGSKLPLPLARAALAALISDGKLAASGDLYHPPGHTPGWPAGLKAAWQQVEAALADAGKRPPTVHELAEHVGQERAAVVRTLEFAAKHGLVVKVESNRWFTSQQIEQLLETARETASKADGMILTATFRDASGLGRNLAISMLEYFDRAGHTTRIGDTRRIRS